MKRVLKDCYIAISFFGLLINGCAIKNSTLPASSCHWTKRDIPCVTFIDNYDADTIRVNIPGVPPLFGDKMAVRVAGVDSPEIKSKNVCERDLAVKAREFVRGRLQAAQRIDLRNVKDDMTWPGEIGPG